MNRKQVLVTPRSFSESSKGAADLQRAGFELTFAKPARPLLEDELLIWLRNQRFDAVLAGLDDYTQKVLEAAAPRLKIVARYGVGVDAVDLEIAERLGIIVTNTPGVNSVAVAELAVAMMLALSRALLPNDRNIRDEKWKKVSGTELSGKTVGLIGLGAVGFEVVKRTVAFGMKVIAYDPIPNPDAASFYGVEYVGLEDVFRQSDFVSLHAPAGSDTKGLVNRKTLSAMKPTAYLINTARGEFIVEEDLFEALSKGIIAGAGLDAFVREPLSKSPLFGLDNVLLSPHVGGTTLESSERMGECAAGDIIRVLNGQPPMHPVQPK